MEEEFTRLWKKNFSMLLTRATAVGKYNRKHKHCLFSIHAFLLLTSVLKFRNNELLECFNGVPKQTYAKN